MILVSFGLWFVVVFGIRIAVWGNPLYQMVAEAEVSLLSGVEALVLGHKPEGTPAELQFVRSFTRRVLTQMGLLCLEVVVFAHLWWVRVLPLLCLAVLAKDLAGVGAGLLVARRDRDRGVLAVVRKAPLWLLLAERVSAILSAGAALVLFLTINGLRPW